MSLAQEIDRQLKSAMLAKEAERVGTLRLLKSALGYAQIEKKTEALSDAEAIAIVQREIKKRRDAAEQYEKGGRPELAAKEKNEIGVLETFLPQPLSQSELEALVRQTIQETGAAGKKQMGAVIKAVQAKSLGRADGRAISAAVSKLLPA